MKTIASIQARMGSSRLPGKVLLPLGEKQVLERVVSRCDSASSVDEAVLTIGDSPENDVLTEWAERNNVPYVVEVEEDLLLRHHAVAKEFNADQIVRVTADCPFIAPNEIDRVVGEHDTTEIDYSTNWTGNTPIGATVDVISRSTLDKLKRAGDSHPVLPLRNNSQNWNINYSDSDDWRPYAEVHLAVDEPDEYWNLTDGLKSVGDDTMAIAKWLLNREQK